MLLGDDFLGNFEFELGVKLRRVFGMLDAIWVTGLIHLSDYSDG